MGSAEPNLHVSAEREERPPLPTVVPMCVIVDDRVDVYDSVSNQALLQVRAAVMLLAQHRIEWCHLCTA